MAQPTPEELYFHVPELTHAIGYAASRQAEGYGAAILTPDGRVEGRYTVLTEPVQRLGEAAIGMVMEQFPQITPSQEHPLHPEEQQVNRRVYDFMYGNEYHAGFANMPPERQRLVGDLACRLIWAMPEEIWRAGKRPVTGIARQGDQLSLNVTMPLTRKPLVTPEETARTLGVLREMGTPLEHPLAPEAAEITQPLERVGATTAPLPVIKDTDTLAFPALGLMIEGDDGNPIISRVERKATTGEGLQDDLRYILSSASMTPENAANGKGLVLEARGLKRLAAKVIKLITDVEYNQINAAGNAIDRELRERVTRVSGFLEQQGKRKGRAWIVRALKGDPRSSGGYIKDKKDKLASIRRLSGNGMAIRLSKQSPRPLLRRALWSLTAQVSQDVPQEQFEAPAQETHREPQPYSSPTEVTDPPFRIPAYMTVKPEPVDYAPVVPPSHFSTERRRHPYAQRPHALPEPTDRLVVDRGGNRVR